MKTLTTANEHDKANAERTLARSLKFSQQQREAARALIQPADLIQDILDIDGELQPIPEDDGSFTYPEKESLASAKMRIDIKFRLLNKALPDLKSTEITGIIEHNHGLDVSKMPDVELAQRLLLWQAAQHSIAHSPNIIDITPTVVSETQPESTYDFL